MKTFSYGIFAEDDANKIFVKHAVQQMIEHFGCAEKVNFVIDEDFTKAIVAKNSEYVYENFINNCLVGFRRFELDICFVCMDREDRNYEKTFEKMQKSVAYHQWENKVVISIAVQSMEYWLWYLKEKNENPTFETTAKIEDTKTRKEMKGLVYGSVSATNKKSNPIVTNLSQNIDFEWLIKHSDSFRDFYEQVKTLLKNITSS